jgi:hypothetical protein
MNKYQELAAELIDTVEDKILQINPKVDKIAAKKHGHTLIPGPYYYELEDAIAEDIETFVRSKRQHQKPFSQTPLGELKSQLKKIVHNKGKKK